MPNIISPGMHTMLVNNLRQTNVKRALLPLFRDNAHTICTIKHACAPILVHLLAEDRNKRFEHVDLH